MKRKLLALICALALVLSVSVSASAACPWGQSLTGVFQTTLSGKSAGTGNFYSYLYALLQSRFGAAEDTEKASETVSVQEDTNSEENTDPIQDQENQESQTQTADFSAQARAVLELVNQYRARYGLSALTLDTTLCTVAQVKAQDLHDNHYFSHQSPTYGSPYDLMADYGVRYRTAGENIAMGYSSAQAVMTAWMNSTGHRANILNADYTTLGVGYVADGGYYVQEFIG